MWMDDHQRTESTDRRLQTGNRTAYSLRLCANTLGQIVIPAALDDMETPMSMVRPGGRIYEQREATIRELEKIDGLSFVKNNSAFYIFPKMDADKFHITDDKQFASDLLHETNILLVPGSGFDWHRPDHFRLVMLPQAEVLSDAMKRMGEFLDGYDQRKSFKIERKSA